jgi:hypothetical protein
MVSSLGKQDYFFNLSLEGLDGNIEGFKFNA